MRGVPSESVIDVKSRMHLPKAMVLQFCTLDQDSSATRVSTEYYHVFIIMIYLFCVFAV
jgi:hypothetical protein